MKRWEEQQRKKLYNNRISQAKPTLVTQPHASKKGSRVSTAASGQTRSGMMSASSYNYEDLYLPSNDTQMLMSSPSASNPYMTPVSSHQPDNMLLSQQSQSSKRQDLPIFQLLKAFKLQQYAQKLSEIGYGQDIYKLALLNQQQRQDLISSLKVLPGHSAKLMSLFDVIDELYPKKVVTEQLKQYTPGVQNKGFAKHQTKRVQSAYRLHTSQQQSRGTTKGVNPRSLINQYEALDPQTKQAFNNTFLMNLESVKYQIPQLFQHHFNPLDRNAAINSIFPPQYYYNPQQFSMSDQNWGVQAPENEEINQLVTKYVGRAVAQGVGSAQNRQGSNSANRQQVQENEKHLKIEMAHTMKVIERINKEFEQLTKSSQQEYDEIKQNQMSRGSMGYSRQSTGGNNTTYGSQNKRKNSTASSVASSKPQSVQQTKRNTAQLPAGLQKQQQQKTAVIQANSQVDMGRFQSNRQIARQKQAMHPRVITEHEVASEMTTPSKMREPSLTKNNTSHNTSAIGLISGLKLGQTQTSGFKQTVQVNEDEENSEETSVEEVQPIEEPLSKQSSQHMEVEDVPPSFAPLIQQFEEHKEQYDNPEKQYVESAKPLPVTPGELIPPKKERKLSPLLEKDERDLLWNNILGHSLDTKQVTSALGYLDLKQICLCLAHALNRHIQFSQGFYFLDDLQEQIKALHLEDHLKLDFSYELDPKMKIELPTSHPKQQLEDTKKEFEELRNKLKPEKKDMQQEESSGMSPVKKRGIKEPSGPFEYKEGFKLALAQQRSVSDEDQFERAEPIVNEYGEEEIQQHVEEEYIQDYYGNQSGAGTLEKKRLMQQVINDLEGGDDIEEEEENMRQGGDEPIDLDYSYSHLEDFLRSHRNTTVINMGSMVTNSNVHSQQKPNAAGANATSTTTQQLMNTFLTSYNKNKNSQGGVSARGSHQPPILVESIPERKAADESGGSSSDQIGLMKLKPIEMVLGSPSVADSMSESSTSGLHIDVRTKEGFKDLIRFQMRIFDCNYDFESDQLIDAPLPDENPTLEELYYYCKYVIISGRMEKEIPILCLVYIERFLSKTGILMNHLNWKRLTLISLCLASKIWDDDSLENVHFPKVMPDITVKEVAGLEKVFLQFLDFDLLMRGAEYAKYYFVLKTFAQESGFNSCLPPVGPLTAQKMSELQNNTARVESELRDRYEVKLSLQKTM